MPTKSQKTTEPRRRSPTGVESAKPVWVRFHADELARFEAVAATEQRTMAATVRLAALRGLTEYEHDPQALTHCPVAKT